jgi:hypothetical protein
VIRPRRPAAALALLLAGVAVAAAAALPAGATTTGSRTAPEKTITLPATPGKTVVTYQGHAPFANGSAGIGVGDPLGMCEPADDTFNDQHFIKVVVPAGMDDRYDTLIRFQIDWTFTGNESAADMALHLFGPDGKLVASSDGSQASEGINITDKAPGVYDALVCAFQTGPTGQDYTGTVTAQTVATGTFPAAKGVTPPSYRQYEAPLGISTDAGEPSIGNNWKTGNTLFTSNTNEYVVKFGTGSSSTWTLVNDDVADPSNKISLDPIGFTDSVTGRTFVSQLYLACSAAAYSDDDFATQAVPTQGCGSLVNGFDHQTFGGGPFPEGAIPGPLTPYPHAVYYCSQAPGLLTPGATCARSDDGGLTFGPAIPIYDGTQCSGIHGHIRVGPKGTAYVPNVKCGGNQGVAVSKDGGLTWNVYHVPDSIEGTSDPSVSAGTDGTVYFGYGDGTGEPKIAVSTDEGKTWSKSVDVGIPFGIKNTEFSEVIAGDGDRAAFAFLGTPTRGSTQASSFGKDSSGSTFVGAEWHMYVATTYDRGKTWTTVDATPKDPVQRGCIWNSGGSNPCRNLLDFNDITLDKTGHVLVGFADGCVGPSTAAGNDCIASRDVSANKLVNHGAIIRQIGGKGLFAAYDATATTPVDAPPPVTSGPPPSTGSGSPNAGGNLAATGGLPAAGVGVLLLLLGLAAHRRRHA